MNPDLNALHPYPFEKLQKLKGDAGSDSSESHIALSIGEPKHALPNFIPEAIVKNTNGLSQYAPTKGSQAFRETVCQWLSTRFDLPSGTLDPDRHVLPACGTREALFAIAQSVIDRTKSAKVLMPNPFYQIYEGAALLAGAEPVFLATTRDNDFLPDLDAVDATCWQQCQLIYVCSPGNPTGRVLPLSFYQQLIELADRYDFVIASDECYSELYFDESQPPLGLLQACQQLGRHDFKRCLVFHSLSKRSNLPGLRSGFVAGDAEVLSDFLRYRTYHGCAMSLFVQEISIEAWSDETHVVANRDLYRQKFDQVLNILDPVWTIQRPDAGFYLWPTTPIDDEQFALELHKKHNVTVLPGRYLSRDVSGTNPGKHHVRMALVATLDECTQAAQRIKSFIQTL